MPRGAPRHPVSRQIRCRIGCRSSDVGERGKKLEKKRRRGRENGETRSCIRPSATPFGKPPLPAKPRPFAPFFFLSAVTTVNSEWHPRKIGAKNAGRWRERPVAGIVRSGQLRMIPLSTRDSTRRGKSHCAVSLRVRVSARRPCPPLRGWLPRRQGAARPNLAKLGHLAPTRMLPRFTG